MLACWAACDAEEQEERFNGRAEWDVSHAVFFLAALIIRPHNTDDTTQPSRPVSPSDVHAHVPVRARAPAHV